ncbi:pyridoxamine 5'-phosphate oxidase [Marinospirillum alkaliphilum]|uniref:Pyridoxine/pyridoxamine 5'-phosphate oxidase n=1 Tax=Marinospirillum alkaliphilum DSM 21637 TaxID=1122209 RepID=A0A1K1XLB0_9GAMM|nr:pyridoxamine 5'-phosphate oxidase [Marinospirillum alkaliphilum]SFX50391.1 Pyridoxamine 5'-phosphate oxidase [Marinospirillum alkaliphilum DSM 21637]
MNRDLAAMRRNYAQDGLTEDKAGSCPFALFTHWLAEAVQTENLDPNAMTLATQGKDGQPRARILLLKGFSKEKGWVFYTNYESDKGQELAENPRCSLLFWWEMLERQVRIEGRVEKLSDDESDAYYTSRPRDSQLGAWVSEQSQIISGREVLSERQAILEEQYREFDTLPRPPHWGGYRVIPTLVEFWQGQPSRLHDRIRFRLEGGEWIRERLSP